MKTPPGKYPSYGPTSGIYLTRKHPWYSILSSFICSNLYVIITVSKGSASNSIQHSDDDSIILKEANISTELNNSWIALKFPLDNVTGNTLREILLEDEIQLDSEKIYQVTLFLRNEYRNISRHSGYTLGITAPASQNYKLLLFLLVIPVICFIIFM